MIQTTLGSLVNAEAALAELSKQRLPAKFAYQASKILRLYAAEAKHFYDQKNALIKELGTARPQTDDEQKRNAEPVIEVKADSPKMPEFILRLNELAAVEVKLDVEPIPLAVLGDISAADIVALGSLLDTGEPVEKPKAKLRSVKRA